MFFEMFGLALILDIWEIQYFTAPLCCIKALRIDNFRSGISDKLKSFVSVLWIVCITWL